MSNFHVIILLKNRKKKGAENRPQFVKVFLFFRTETQHQSEPEFHQLACQMCEQRWA